MDIGTAIVLCVLIVCLMAPIVIESLGGAGAFRMSKQKRKRKKR